MPGFGVFSRRAPEEFAQADLPQAVVSQDHLADGHVTGGDLPHPQHQAPGELGQDDAAMRNWPNPKTSPTPNWATVTRPRANWPMAMTPLATRHLPRLSFPKAMWTNG